MNNSNRVRLFSTLISLSILLSACGGTSSANVAQSNLGRITSPNIPSSDSRALVDGNNAFALDIYQTLRSQNGNLILSPFSISLAVVMTYAGAHSETESQI